MAEVHNVKKVALKGVLEILSGFGLIVHPITEDIDIKLVAVVTRYQFTNRVSYRMVADVCGLITNSNLRI